MWKIKDIKKGARNILKNNFWTLMFIGLLMAVILGEDKISQNIITNIKNLTNVSTSHENKDVLINKYADSVINQILFGNSDGTIKDLNEKHNVSKGTFYVIFNIITDVKNKFIILLIL